MTVLFGNDAISVLMLSAKKRYSKKLKKIFDSRKICLKVKGIERFKTPTDFHIKTCRSPKRRAILKSPGTIFRRTYTVSAGLKMKPLRKCVLQC